MALYCGLVEEFLCSEMVMEVDYMKVDYMKVDWRWLIDCSTVMAVDLFFEPWLKQCSLITQAVI